MRILLFGEYSNVHCSLACGLRSAGHEVTVVSNGDFWKGYPCDIMLDRPENGRLGAVRYLSEVLRTFPDFKGYDIVQLINPMFLELKAEHIRPFYNLLRKRNGKVFLDAYGMDYYYIKACLENRFQYSELAIGGKFRDIADNRASVRDWMDGAKGPLNRMIAEDCDGIIAGLWEYWISYKDEFPDKTTYIPYPVPIPGSPAERYSEPSDGIVRLFMGIQRKRSEFKGTDILLPILRDIADRNPDKCSLTTVENVPFAEYSRIMRSSDVLVDQLYSPTPSMNSLLAMSQGIAVAGGGELEPYRIIGEDSLHPVINLPCDEDGIRKTFLDLIGGSRQELAQRKSDSIGYVRKHHDSAKVAAAYIDFWNRH